VSLAVGNAERYAQIESLAIADGLTGVFTRGYLDERLQEEFAKARHHGRPFSLLMLDIDHFKAVNDQHGHRFGDEVLRWLARRITAQSRETDFVARYGGEEFVVLMPNTAGHDALAFGERLRRAVAADPFQWEGTKLKVTVSGGVAAVSGEVTDEKDLLRRADAALYRAKGAGRDKVFRDE
jgi:diguanylate cyclase (GGDEF)-like protein